MFRLTLESLAKDREEWMPWIRELTPKEMKSLLIAILTSDLLNFQEDRDSFLMMLGTYVHHMTTGELEKWAPAILLVRNRTLAARRPLPPG